jgi:prepilin-type N-terminal cleavage/methylation domain-containing protein
MGRAYRKARISPMSQTSTSPKFVQTPRWLSEMSCGSRRERAFTLVELLVVIGIISLLVAILLPALNKARQQANWIDCQSRLRQMGQALEIYVSDNRGLLPWGDVRNDPTATTKWESGALPNSSDEEFSWYWTFTLSQEMQGQLISATDGLVHSLSPVFRDVDTIAAKDFRYVNHYTCNPRVFPDNWETDANPDGFIAPQNKTPRKLSNIRPSTTFLIWDAPQCADWNNNAYEQATEIDGNELTFGSYLFRDQPTAVQYNRPLSPGLVSQSQSASACRAIQKKWNVDLQPGAGYFLTHMRFRHLSNTTLNGLCVDGHVESRPVGTFMVLDVCVKYPY